MQMRWQLVKPLEIFCCYAHEDEALLNKLKTHLKPLQWQGLIDVWHDRDISAGTQWEQEINKHLDEADIILLLVSPDFIASDYCYNIEIKRALERDKRKEARVIPIILRPVDWQNVLGKLQALPTDGTPVIDRSWHSSDEALYIVAQGIRKVVEELKMQSPDISSGLDIQMPKLGSQLDSHAVVEEANELEKQFRAKNYNGISNGEPLLIVNGSIPVVLSCPHAVAHYRSGERIKPHLYTGALTRQLAERTSSNALVYARTTDEVPDWGKEGPYKRQLTKIIQKSNACFVLDIQGSDKSIQGDVLIGIIGQASLLEKRYLLDIFKRALREAGLTKIVVDRPDYGFDAGGQYTITRYTSEIHKTPAMQLSIGRKFRNPVQAPQDYVMMLNALSNAVIEMYRACSEGKH